MSAPSRTGLPPSVQTASTSRSASRRQTPAAPTTSTRPSSLRASVDQRSSPIAVSTAINFRPAPPTSEVVNSQQDVAEMRLEIAELRRFVLQQETQQRGRSRKKSREIHQQYQRFVAKEGVAFDFDVLPSRGNNRVVIDGIMNSVLAFVARRGQLTDPEVIGSYRQEIEHRILKHREYLRKKSSLQNRPQEQSAQEARRLAMEARKARKIERRRKAFSAIGRTLPRPTQCSSVEALTQYLFHPELVSDDEDDTESILEGTTAATRFIAIQPSWRSSAINHIYSLLDNHVKRGATARARARVIREMGRPLAAVFPEWVYEAATAMGET
ncbi:hypothetical protein MBANPS3_006968 [Mucor bainieri]